MPASTSNLNGGGWTKIPTNQNENLIIQWGIGYIISGEKSGQVNFPVAFPNKIFGVLVTDTGAACISYGTAYRTLTGFTQYRYSDSAANVNGFWIALGC